MTVLESGENVQLMSNSTDRDFVMLHPYYTYTFIISAVTIGPGPPSAVHNVITADEGNLHLCLTASSNNTYYAKKKVHMLITVFLTPLSGTSLLTVQLVEALSLALQNTSESSLFH